MEFFTGKKKKAAAKARALQIGLLETQYPKGCTFDYLGSTMRVVNHREYSEDGTEEPLLRCKYRDAAGLIQEKSFTYSEVMGDSDATIGTSTGLLTTIDTGAFRATGNHGKTDSINPQPNGEIRTVEGATRLSEAQRMALSKEAIDRANAERLEKIQEQAELIEQKRIARIKRRRRNLLVKTAFNEGMLVAVKLGEYDPILMEHYYKLFLKKYMRAAEDDK